MKKAYSVRELNSKTTALIIISLLILISVFYFYTRPERVMTEVSIPELNINPPTELPFSTILEKPETQYPKPIYIPSLKSYDIDKSGGDIWYAKDPSSYIIPENEWVKYYASQLFLDYDGSIKYKTEKIIQLVDENGNILQYTNKPFVNTYTFDYEQFGTGSPGSLANDDYWANVDYYLSHGLKGDCDEWANTVTSMMLSGEMSVWQDNKLMKQVIPAKAVLGYVGGIRDVWVEYQAYKRSWITSTSKTINPGSNLYQSTTIFVEKNNQFKPVFDYTDKYFRRV